MIDIAVKEYHTVAGMIVFFMLGDEVLICKLFDMVWMSAGLEAIAVIREQELVHLILYQRVDGGIGASHLVENDTRTDIAAVLLLLEMPALLHEYLRLLINRRMENSVHVYPHKVLEILLIAAGNGIQRLIGESKCIYEGLK